MINDSNLEKLLDEDGYLVRPIVGVSMMPLLDQNKDAVKLKKTNEDLNVYDVPLYRRPTGEYVLHRIIKVRKNYYIIRGDNCSMTEKVPKSWILAVAEGFYKEGKYIPCTDENYKQYSVQIVKGWRRKKYKYLVKAVFRKLAFWKKKNGK